MTTATKTGEEPDLIYLLTAHSFSTLIRNPSHAHEALQLRNKAGSLRFIQLMYH
jgi:hypothetical protein